MTEIDWNDKDPCLSLLYTVKMLVKQEKRKALNKTHC